MSDQTSLFGTNNSQATPANQEANPLTPNQNDPLATMLSAIRNEKGEQKYKTVEDALNALKHSQEYIPNLKQTLEQQARELEEARKAAEQISELRKTVEALTSAKPAEQNTPVSGITEDKVTDLVQQVLAQTEQKKSALQNTQVVTSKMIEKFGDKAEEVFYLKAKELGIEVAEINSLAAKSPKLVLNLMGIQDTVMPNQNSRQSTPNSSINTSGMAPATESYIGRNKNPVIVGATSRELMEEAQRARRMVEELNEKGLSLDELTKPSNYFKYFTK